MIGLDDAQALRSATAYDSSGQKVGPVTDVYLDDATGQPAWATVATGPFGSRAFFVPLAGASVDGRRLVLGFGADAVRSAPHVHVDEHLGHDEEDALYAHYGLSRPAIEALPEAAATADAAPTASGLSASDLDEPLHRAEEATADAIEVAQKADPLGDGSYAGDASKAALIDTKDLEAHDHAAAAKAAETRAAHAPTINAPLLAADGEPEPLATRDLDHGITAAELDASDKQAEAGALAAENAWARAHGRPVQADSEADL